VKLWVQFAGVLKSKRVKRSQQLYRRISMEFK